LNPCPGIEKDNIVSASMINGGYVSIGKKGMLIMLRLLIIIEVIK